MKASLLVLCAASLSLAAPAVQERATGATVTVPAPSATIIGLDGPVEKFLGIPFAQPPTGSLRLKPPQPLTATSPAPTIKAKVLPDGCPQLYFSTDPNLNEILPTSVLGELLDTPLFQAVTLQSEDCLYMNVYRPKGVDPSAKLPVLFWIFGGGFEFGSNAFYDGSIWVQESINQGKPIIFAAVNYRVAGFGFLAGKEILADGAANLGLLDQRLGLQWIADNIAAFGGDPDKVTIWGESAGSISVFDQMAMYDGDNTYNGKQLFRGAIMNSGSVVPAEPVDGDKGQLVYDTVVNAAGCADESDTLECLRGLPYEKLLNAMNSLPSILSYFAISLAYLPRPDGVVLTASPDVLVQEGKFARVPFIIGDQEDEGTIFAMFQANITTRADIADYFTELYFPYASTALMNSVIATYPNISSGSPFRTGALNDWYPQFKVLAAILGDLTFTLTRRIFLTMAAQVAPEVPSWSYLSSYDYGTPILGTFHGSDLLQVFYGVLPNYASKSFFAYYLSFVNTLDPNDGTDESTFLNWPQWADSGELLNTNAFSAQLIADDFRNATYQIMVDNLEDFRI